MKKRTTSSSRSSTSSSRPPDRLFVTSHDVRHTMENSPWGCVLTLSDSGNPSGFGPVLQTVGAGERRLRWRVLTPTDRVTSDHSTRSKRRIGSVFCHHGTTHTLNRRRPYVSASTPSRVSPRYATCPPSRVVNASPTVSALEITGYPSTCSISSEGCGLRTICSGPSNSFRGCRSNAVGRSKGSKNVSQASTSCSRTASHRTVG